jgi:hypothetical protein
MIKRGSGRRSLSFRKGSRRVLEKLKKVKKVEKKDDIQKQSHDQNKIERDKQIQSFVCPEDWEPVMMIGHNDGDTKVVDKEVIFWKKYKPDFEYQTISAGSLVTMLLRKKRKVKVSKK